MTIKEFYEWAVENKVEEYDIEIEGKYGCYHPHINDIEISNLYKEVVL